MLIRRLTLSSFRNLAAQSVEFPSRVAVFVGRNGQGKTSLLEALYLLAHTKSFRTSRLREVVAWGGTAGAHSDKPVTRVEAEATDRDGDITLSYTIRDGQREIFLSEKKITAASSFFGIIKAVEFTPEDLFLVRGSPQERRRFLDRSLSLVDKSYVHELVHYQRALRNRNQLLLQSAKSQLRAPELASQLAIWEQLLIDHGRAVAERRRRYTGFLSEALDGIYQGLLSGNAGERPEEHLAVQHLSAYYDGGELRSAEQLRTMYETSREKDFRLRSTAIGTHRDDLEILFQVGAHTHPAREYASQGQCRSIALALKMAAVAFIAQESGEDPIVLLDDVESELDAARRKALSQFVVGLRSQVILTTTDISTIAGELRDEAATFTIERGAVVK